MDSLFKCPVCQEVPEGKIFHCINKHVICYSCLSTTKSCTTCGVSLVGDENRIRYAALETVLDSADIPCPNISLGCKIQLKRGAIQGHFGKECPYGGVKVNLCKQIGYESCTFKCNSRQVPSIVEHFKSSHEAAVIQSSSATIEFTDFAKILNRLESTRYVGAPLIMQRVGHEITTSFLILPIINCESYHANVPLKTCSWLCIFLGELSNERKQFSAEISIKSQAPNSSMFKWTNVACCMENFEQFLKTPLHLMPWSLLKVHCQEDNLLVEMRIQQDVLGPIKSKSSLKAVSGLECVKLKMPLESGKNVLESLVAAMNELSVLGSFSHIPDNVLITKVKEYIKNSSGLPEASVKLNRMQVANNSEGKYSDGTGMVLWFKTTRESIRQLAAKTSLNLVFYDQMAAAFAANPENLTTPLRQVMLLCPVQLGQGYVSDKGYAHWSRRNIPNGFDSAMGWGRLTPDRKQDYIHGNYIIPCGPTVEATNIAKGSLKYNEYISRLDRVLQYYAIDIEISPSK